VSAGRASAAALAAVWLACAAPAPARAEAVSAAELRSLGAAAARDEAARARLRGIDAVDGRPVAVGAIVAGARPDEIAGRIALALDGVARGGAPSGSAAAPRGRAREILRERRFRGTELPRPFTGVLRWLGERLDPVARLIDSIARALPGGRSGLVALAGLLLLLAAFALSRRFIRRGAGRSGATGVPRAARALDPRALEREADAAEREGRFEAAVRLRMRAGLLRLDAGQVIAYRPSLTTGEVARALGSPVVREGR